MPTKMVDFFVPPDGEKVTLDIFNCTIQDLLDIGVGNPQQTKELHSDYQGFLDALELSEVYARFATEAPNTALLTAYTDLRAACLTPTTAPGQTFPEAGNFGGVSAAAHRMDLVMTFTADEKTEINAISNTYLFRSIFT